MGYKEYIQRGIVGRIEVGNFEWGGLGVVKQSIVACISQGSSRETEPVEIFKEAYYKVIV